MVCNSKGEQSPCQNTKDIDKSWGTYPNPHQIKQKYWNHKGLNK